MKLLEKLKLTAFFTVLMLINLELGSYVQWCNDKNVPLLARIFLFIDSIKNRKESV